MKGFDVLDATSLLSRLDDATRAAFASIEVVDAIDSTNSELLRRRTPDSGIVALFADRQLGGRGRQGRPWASPPGANLYLSVSRRFSGELARLGGLSLVAGIACAEAMRAIGAGGVGVKWPNDLVVDDDGVLRKLGGILIEGGLQDGAVRAVIGIGLNVRMPAEAAAAIDQPWTDLQAQIDGGAPAREVVAATLLDSLAEALARFDAEGLAPFLPRFEALDMLRDAQVDALIADRMVTGVVVGIADDGALRLRADDRLQTLHAGEVRVRRRGLRQAGGSGA
ncbi:MAG: biotin--[acetyl-CoA-carboxylase] ligase [Lysobacter sp.]|nr:biotin--[acetyl-CoA-carboxylase] ligase [Lysobacter sp.]